MNRLLLLTLLALIFSEAQASEPTTVAVGEKLPAVQMQGLNGPNKSLACYHGKPLIINVWASWCEPCRAEMASLEQLAWIEGSGDFNIIGVSTDDYPSKARFFLDGRNTTIRHYIDQRLILENIFGAKRIPLTLFVDSQGAVITKVFGAKPWSDPKLVEFVKRTLFPEASMLDQ